SISSENYKADENLDIEGLIFGSNATGKIIEVLVDKSADRAFRANLPTKIIKEEAISDKIIKVSFRFENLDYLNEWLLQFGDKVKVAGPDELKKKREILLRKMLNS
ncbi:MAG: WYL domain-containing protein, partial [Balneolaceae bacterium]|nr:WYL domain-containing protein [Balneolaceae bacterium]